MLNPINLHTYVKLKKTFKIKSKTVKQGCELCVCVRVCRSHRRLLLTGTPLQNSLMELWSLMHFLMPHVFQSHREFKEWFSNPLTGMIEGSQEYNEGLVKRLHKVLRPFLLRRIKVDVEKQMPKKFEHVVRCRLSKRQRFLYDDFMALASYVAALLCRVL